MEDRPGTKRRQGNVEDTGCYLPTRAEIKRACEEIRAKRNPLKVGSRQTHEPGIREYTFSELQIVPTVDLGAF